MRDRPRIYRVLLTTMLVGVLAACADLNDTGLSLLSTKVQAYAIVDEQLVQGEMQLYPDHTGTITLRFDDEPGSVATETRVTPRIVGRPLLTSCVGRMRYTSTTAGIVDLRCNDGAMADIRLALIGDTRGYGYGNTATGLASVVFGMGPAEARAHLTVPPNRQLLVRTESTGLELR